MTDLETHHSSANMNAAGVFGSVKTHHSGANMHATGILGALLSGNPGRLACTAISQGCRADDVRIVRADGRGSNLVGLEHGVTPWHDRLEKRYRRTGRYVNK
jgi:hypothetical protein